MTPEMLMADGVRFGLLRDWLSDLPDDYCLAIWRERVRHETGDPEGDPYCVRLVSGDPLNQHEREALGSAPTLNEALSKACDSTMSDEALREIADYERGSRPALAGSPDGAACTCGSAFAGQHEGDCAFGSPSSELGEAPLPITTQQVSQANALIERYAPAAESTTDVQIALGLLGTWITSHRQYPRP